MVGYNTPRQKFFYKEDNESGTINYIIKRYQSNP